MAFAGYSYLIEAMSLSVCPLKRSAVVKPVTRISVIGDALAVPASVAPAEGDFLAHILFALKHEGTHLAVLAQALPRIPAESLLNELAKAPNGIYLRKACFLWEHFTALRLDHKIPVRGAPAPLFDPVRYLTGPAVRNPRWRIDFNGLGSLDYCATVERNETIERLLDFDILGRSAEFVSSLPPGIMDRAINWAYLHETRDLFAIEPVVRLHRGSSGVSLLGCDRCCGIYPGDGPTGAGSRTAGRNPLPAALRPDHGSGQRTLRRTRQRSVESGHDVS